MKKNINISIIGGGITGLSTAIALEKLGFQCKVYEKASQLNEVGAGIWMQPNALKVLDWLGVGDEIRNKGVLLHRPDITDSDLKPLKVLTRDISKDEEGNQIISIHRGRLQKVLYDALPEETVVLDSAFSSFIENESGLKVKFENGSEVETDIVLAADGINSKVRQQIFPTSSTRYSGQTSWRGIAKFDIPDALKNAGKEAWGKRIRFGFSQLGENEVYWFAVALADKGGSDSPELKSKLFGMYQSFNPLVNRIIEHTSSENLIRSDIYDLKRLKSWYQGNVCLIGDAGHATTPNMGQGGCQGLEDAYYISKLLDSSETATEAFASFMKLRREKVDYVVKNSWTFGKLAHSPFGQMFLKTMIRMMPESAMEKQMKKLYAIDDF
ncbi:MAG: FAD-dependent monooxygenase [bacterium]|nr:FAD-dependent monooxygenase [bacterium]